MQRYRANRGFFYLIIILSILVALFLSIAVGLIILIVDIGFYYYIRRSTMRAAEKNYEGQMPQDSIPANVPPTPESERIPCKYCGTLIDPTKDRACPNCGAPVG